MPGHTEIRSSAEGTGGIEVRSKLHEHVHEREKFCSHAPHKMSSLNPMHMRMLMQRILREQNFPERSVVVARTLGVGEVGGSIPPAPKNFVVYLRISHEPPPN